MKLQVIMYGLGGELDRQTIEVSDPDGDMTMSELAAKVEWIVRPGDTIKIVEVE